MKIIKLKKGGNNTNINYNPPLQVQKLDYNFKTFYLINDSIFGGTKLRVLLHLLQNITENEIVYAGPDSGMAQIAIGAVAKILNKKATIFVNTYYKMEPKPFLVEFGQRYLNINYNFATSPKGRTLKDTDLDAQKYVEEDNKNRKLLPFGLKDEKVMNYFEKLLKEALQNINPPKRMWLVVGSGMILKTFQTIWPSTQFMCVQVGKTVWPDQLMPRTLPDGKIITDKLFVAPEYFTQLTKILPPYPSIPWYDAKLWQFVIKDGEDGDYIWNVAQLPTEESLKQFFSIINNLKKNLYD